MQLTEFIAKLEQDVLFVEDGTLGIQSELEQFEDWDSMAVVAVIALADGELGIRLNSDQILSCKTVGDLITLVNDKLED